MFIILFRYFYVLFYPEIQENITLNDTLTVLGLSTDMELSNKYGRSNLFNNNYLIVLTGLLQYGLYTSDYSKSAFTVSPH